MKALYFLLPLPRDASTKMQATPKGGSYKLRAYLHAKSAQESDIQEVALAVSGLFEGYISLAKGCRSGEVVPAPWGLYRPPQVEVVTGVNYARGLPPAY